MLEFYQNLLSESAKTLLNSEAQIRSHVIQLGSLKAQNLTEKIIGKKYSFHSLLPPSKECGGEYEEVDYKAVHIDSSLDDWNLSRKVREDETLITITITFLRDPSVILSSKLKLTDTEKKMLRKLNMYYDIRDGYNSSWFKGSEVTDLGDRLVELKHRIYTSISLSWDYSLSQLLSDDFLTRGIKAQQSLILNTTKS